VQAAHFSRNIRRIAPDARSTIPRRRYAVLTKRLQFDIIGLSISLCQTFRCIVGSVATAQCHGGLCQIFRQGIATRISGRYVRSNLKVVCGAKEGREDVLVSGIVDEEGVETYHSTDDCAYEADAVGDEKTGFGVDVSDSPVLHRYSTLTGSATEEFLLDLCQQA
jgi:hypothetical protein